jgi:hypothetical protein
VAYSDPNSIHNPATGTSPPASWGDNIRDNVVWLAGDGASGNSKPMCRVYHNASQNIATATWTSVLCNSERYDIGGMHSTTTNTSRITVPTGGAGVYHIGGQVRFATNATGIRAIRLLLNNTTSIGQRNSTATSTDPCHIGIACDYKLAAGDYVEVQVYQSSGGILAVDSSSAESPEFYVHWVGVG